MLTLGTLQPFRYRGYVYDEKTKLYNLHSRYYNPRWGRFISGDAWHYGEEPKAVKKLVLIVIILTFAFCSNHVQATEENTVEELLSGMGYGFIEERPLSYVFADENNRAGFYDKKSGYIQKPLYDDIYDVFSDDPDSPILAKTGDTAYYIERSNGNVLFEIYHFYDNPYMEFVNGYALISYVDQPDEQSNESLNVTYGLINCYGIEIPFPEHIIPYGFVNERGFVRILHEDTDKSGIANLAGEVVLEPVYDAITEFINGYAAICLNGLWGHISETGVIMVEPQYKMKGWGYHKGYTFDESGYAIVELEDGSETTIDVNGVRIDSSRIDP